MISRSNAGRSGNWEKGDACRPLFPYPGSKWKLGKIIAGVVSQYAADTYVEAFGGSISVLLRKPPHKIEVINDINADIVNFYRCVIENPRRLYAVSLHFIGSRELIVSLPPKRDPYWRAAWWWWRQCYRMSGAPTGFALKNNPGWGRYVERLASVSRRLQRVCVERLDWRDVIREYDSPCTVFYIDPPYVAETRSPLMYECDDMTDDDHAELVSLIQRVSGYVVVSGYDHGIYRPLDQALERIDLDVYSSMASTDRETGTRREVLWCTPTGGLF